MKVKKQAEQERKKLIKHRNSPIHIARFTSDQVTAIQKKTKRLERFYAAEEVLREVECRGLITKDTTIAVKKDDILLTKEEWESIKLKFAKERGRWAG